MAGYTFVSVPKKSDAAGRPTGKKNIIILFKWPDVKTFTKDEKGVLVTAFDFQEGQKPIGVYATSSTIHAYDSLEGDADAKGYIHKVDWETPGDSLELAEMRNHIANAELGAIVIDCSEKNAKIAGTPCTPLLVAKDDSQDNSEAKKNSINLASILRSGPIGRIPLNLIPSTDSEEINKYLGLPHSPASSAGLGV